jgi:ABC-type nitrate/sulfonate/bicarbonate transport system substrate-binding protein
LLYHRNSALALLILITIITIVSNPTFLLHAQSNNNGNQEPIRLGVKVWAPDFFSYLAQEKGFFEKNNVNVELTLVQDYQQILNNYSMGDFDGMIPVYSDLIFQNSQGVDSRVVYAVDLSKQGMF